MPGLPRFSPVGIPQHIIQRGNDRQPCFCEEQHFGVYTNFLKSATNRGIVVGSGAFKDEIE